MRSPQAVVQFSIVVYHVAATGGEVDYSVVVSLIASIGQIYMTYFYIDGLARAYRCVHRVERGEGGFRAWEFVLLCIEQFLRFFSAVHQTGSHPSDWSK